MFRKTALALTLAAPLSAAHAAVLTVDCVAGPFLTIGAAVGAAANGDTIVVHPCATGAYNENVGIGGFDDLHLVAARGPTPTVVAPPVVGSFSAGVGVLWTHPVVIDGGGLPGSCITVRSSTSVSITGFRMRRCQNGVEVLDSRETAVHGNRIEGMRFAGYLEAQSSLSTVTSNLIGASEFGVYLEGTQQIRLHDNRVGLNRVNGMFLAGRRIDVVNNEVIQNGREGIHSVSGAEHRIERNTSLNNGGANIQVGPGLFMVDVIGNDTAGSLVDLSGSDLAANQ